jgi:hypothetical protein
MNPGSYNLFSAFYLLFGIRVHIYIYIYRERERDVHIYIYREREREIVYCVFSSTSVKTFTVQILIFMLEISI